MKRLIVGSVVSVSLMIVAACSGDPTESLRGGIVRLDASPSQLAVQQGRTVKVDVTASDSQGNQIATSFDIATVGAGISVQRDLTFRPVFVNDSTLSPPAQDPTFRFAVTANELVSTSFTITAGGKEVTVPVAISFDPATLPPATVASTGPSAADQTVLTLPAPFIFTPDAAVTFDAGGAITVGVAADGSSLTIFPPPGTTSTGVVSGVGLSYLPSDTGSTVTDVALTIATTVPPQPGTDDPATAPEVTLPPSGETTAFYDGAAFGSPVCGESNAGLPCQLYKITLPADGSIDAALGWSNTTDMGLYVLSADGTTDVIGYPDSGCDVLGNGEDGGAESCTFTLTAGTYLLAVVSNGEFYDPVDPLPDWISLAITSP
jgi:hypothetical protein